MNEDRHIILDNDTNTYPQEETKQEVNEESVAPQVPEKPKKVVNGAAILFVLIILVVLGTTMSLFVIPLFFTKEVQPAIEDNVILSASCSNINELGDYSQGDVDCKNFVCTLNKNGKKITKECAGAVKQIDPEGSLNEEELDDLVDIDG